MDQKKKWTYFLWMLFVCVCICFASHPAEASEDIKITITDCRGIGPDAVMMAAKLPDTYGTFQIYRASKRPSAGGKYALIDSFSGSGNGWASENGGDWHTDGDRKKVICYSKDAQVAGDVLFCDTGLKLGTTYYYKITLTFDEDEQAFSSNQVSARTVLNTPEILKCYANTSRSVKLSWQGVPKAQKYLIYRKTGNSWSLVKTVNKSTISYTDKTVKAGKTYYYRVKAYCQTGGKKIYSAYGSSCVVKLKNPTVSGNYGRGSVYGPSLGSSELTDVRRVVQSFKDNYIKKGMSDYEKVWTAFSYLRANCSYAWRGWQYNGANTAWGALVYGEAQCSGYARGMKALCDAMGVKCYYVHANSKASNPSHQWNLVRVGGKWYVLDAQGGVFLASGATYENLFGMTWDKKGLPACGKKDHPGGGLVASEM